MSEGRFREDLYYRLAVVVISMPPLRECEGDVLLLANEFLRRQAAAQNKVLVFTRKSVKAIESYGWPGNVRELENRIQRAAIMAENGRVTPEDLELTSPYGEYDGVGLAEARKSLERHMIKTALARNKGNLTRSAAELEISRPSLYELIEKLGIARRQDWRVNLGKNDYLTLMTTSFIVMWLGGFGFFYGSAVFKAALFPLAFLGFAIPIPSPLLDRLILLFQSRSADVVSGLFALTWTLFHPEGFFFGLPGLAIRSPGSVVEFDQPLRY